MENLALITIITLVPIYLILFTLALISHQCNQIQIKTRTTINHTQTQAQIQNMF